MIDKNSAEYKTIIGLYEDGRINEQDRDKLLCAVFGEDALKPDAGRAKIVFKIHKKDEGMPSALLDTLLCNAIVNIEGVKNVKVDGDRVTVEGAAQTDDILKAAEGVGVKLMPKDVSVAGGDELDGALNDLEGELDDLEDDLKDLDSDGGEDDSDEPEGLHVHIDDGRTLKEFLTGLGEKIKQAVGAGTKAAADAERILRDTISGVMTKTRESVDKAKKGVDVKISGKHNNVVQTTQSKKYDVPYSEMRISVQRCHSGGMWEYCENTQNSNALLDKCEEALTEEQCAALKKLIKEQFTGKFTLIVDDDVLTVKVKPQKD